MQSDQILKYTLTRKIFIPMEQAIADLIKTRRIERGKEYYSIYVKKPEDFVYDTSDIVIRYYPEVERKIIVCKEIPENIKENMYKFASMKIKDFVLFIEENLELFFRGKIPELEIEEDEMLKDGELSKTFKFPVHNNVSSNIKVDISKTNILLMCCQNIRLVARCNKCGENANLVGNQACRRCGQEIGFIYVPTVEIDNLGFLQMKKCDFVCFNPMKFQFNCEECEKMYESSDIGLGQVFVKKCTGCFKEMKIKVNKLAYYPKKEVKIKEGEELPDKGACKHYKKSFRWFRFSCCNSLYPCDECHNADCNHKAETAFRMVCGLCSKEQSVKQNCDCGMDLKRKHSQFWEGGKGNRDKATMSRKDAKKYGK